MAATQEIPTLVVLAYAGTHPVEKRIARARTALQQTTLGGVDRRLTPTQWVPAFARTTDADIPIN